MGEKKQHGDNKQKDGSYFLQTVTNQPVLTSIVAYGDGSFFLDL